MRALCGGSAGAGGGGCVVISHDQRVSRLDAADVEPLGHVTLLDDLPEPQYGGFGMLEMWLAAMRWLLARKDFDWLAVLSGQCFPVMTVPRIEAELAAAVCDGFLACRPVEDWPFHEARQRYWYQYHELPEFPKWPVARRWLRAANERALDRGRVPRLLVPREKERGFRVGWRPLRPPGVRFYKGSLWWTLRRRAVERVVAFADERPRVLRHYRRIGLAPLESFVATALMNGSAELDLVTDDCRRFIRWGDPASGHPDALTAADAPALLASGSHFARKIDGRRDPVLLDMLEAAVAKPGDGGG